MVVSGMEGCWMGRTTWAMAVREGLEKRWCLSFKESREARHVPDMRETVLQVGKEVGILKTRRKPVELEHSEV